MLLTVDIGNSNIVFGLPEGDGRSRKLYRLGTVADRPAEEYFALADSLFRSCSGSGKSTLLNILGILDASAPWCRFWCRFCPKWYST